MAAWQAGSTSSEQEADFEAEKIMLSVLTAEEREVLGPIVTDVMRSESVREARERQVAGEWELVKRFKN